MAREAASLKASLILDTLNYSRGMSQASKKLTMFKKHLRATSKRLDGFGKRAQKVGGRLTRNLTLPLGIAGGAAIKTQMDFEQSMTKIETLVGISADKVSEMRDRVLELSGETATAPNELAQALFVVTSAGLRGEEALSVLESAAKAGASGLGETASIARAVTGVISSYGSENISAARATDVLTNVVREGNLEAESLAPTLGRVTGLASQLGISFEEVGASIATFTKLGVNTEEAVTGLRSTMNAFIKSPEKAKKVFAKLGLSLSDVRKEIKEKGLAKTLINIIKGAEGNVEVLGALIPNVRGLAAVLGTAGAQADTYESVLENIKGTQDTVNTAFERTSDTGAFKMKQAFADLQAAGIEIGSVLAPVVKGIAEGVSNMAKKFSNLSPGVKKAIVVTAGLTAVAGPLISAIGGVSRALAFLAANPIGLAIAGVAALGAVIATLISRNKGAASTTELMAEVSSMASESISEEQVETKKLLAVARNENVSKNERISAIKELQEKYPKYLKNLSLENINTKETREEIEKLNASMIRQAKLKAVQELITKKVRKQVEAEVSSTEESVDIWDRAGAAILSIVTASSEQERAAGLAAVAEKKRTQTISDLQTEIERLLAMEQNLKKEVDQTTIGQKAGDEAARIRELEKKIKELAKAARSAVNPFDGLSDATGDFTSNAKEAKGAADDLWFSLSELEDAIDEVRREGEKLDETLAGIDLDDFVIEEVVEEDDRELTDAVFEKIMQMRKNAEDLRKAINSTIERGAEELVMSLAETVTRGGDMAANFGKQIFGAIAGVMNELGSAAIKMGIQIEAIKAAIGTLSGGIAIAAGVALKLVAGALQNFLIPSFAEGGAVFGPTLAMVGDNPNASRDPEIISPLSKLPQSGGETKLSGEFTVKGTDLVLVLERTNKHIGRRG